MWYADPGRELKKGTVLDTRAAALALASIFLCAPPDALARSHKPIPDKPKSEPSPQPVAESHLRQLRFSPDGRYALAVNDSGVTVITVQPFRVWFRIPADDASFAEFTPDSGQVVFAASGTNVESPTEVASLRAKSFFALPAHTAPRVLHMRAQPRFERWSISERARVSSISLRRACYTAGLGPDGRTLACVDGDGTLRLLDLPSGEQLLEKRGFGKPFVAWTTDAAGMPHSRFEWGEPGSAFTVFSPDGRYVIATPWDADGHPVVFDLRMRRLVKLKGAAKRIDQRHNFTFVGPERLLVDFDWLSKPAEPVGIVAFPSGEILSKSKVPPGWFYPATDSRFVLVHPCGPRKNHRWDAYSKRSCVAEIGTGRVIVSQANALDILGSFYVAERTNGEIGLYEIGKPGAIAVVSLDIRRGLVGLPLLLGLAPLQ